MTGVGSFVSFVSVDFGKVGSGVSSFGPNLVMTTEIDLRERPLGQGVLCGTLGVER